MVHRLNIDPDMGVVTRMGLATIIQLAFFAGLTGLCIWKLRQRPWLVFGILWFFRTAPARISAWRYIALAEAGLDSTRYFRNLLSPRNRFFIRDFIFEGWSHCRLTCQI
jgi:hypothetical protein